MNNIDQDDYNEYDESDFPIKPKKEKKINKSSLPKKPIKKSSLPKEPIDDEKFLDEATKEFINDLLRDTKNTPPKLKDKKQHKNIKEINNLLTEWFDGFIVVGYNPNGERLTIIHAESDLQEDALIEQLRCIFMKMMM